MLWPEGEAGRVERALNLPTRRQPAFLAPFAIARSMTCWSLFIVSMAGVIRSSNDINVWGNYKTAEK